MKDELALCTIKGEGRDKVFSLPTAPDRDAYHYEIPVDQCDTPEKLLGWLDHLSNKRWMTLSMAQLLILVAEEHGVRVDRNM